MTRAGEWRVSQWRMLRRASGSTDILGGQSRVFRPMERMKITSLLSIVLSHHSDTLHDSVGPDD